MADFINEDDILIFLSFISNQKSALDKKFSFCLLDKTSEKPIFPYGNFYTDFYDLVRIIKKEQLQNPTLHITLNLTDGFGRRTKNILEPRVLCIDLDIPIAKNLLKQIIADYNVHLVVESSPGKYHLYWKISPNIKLEEWSRYQLGLAHHFEADKNLNQVAKTIRMPGIERLTKEGKKFMPEIKFLSEDVTELSLADIGNTFPWIQEAWETASWEIKTERKKLLAAARTNYANVDFTTLATKGRNSLLYVCLKKEILSIKYMEDGKMLPAPSQEEILILAINLNEKFNEPLPEEEIKNIVKKVYERGISSREWKLERLQTVLPANGALHTNAITANGSVELNVNFEYNYLDKVLARNRFTDHSVTARIIQKFGPKLLRVGKNLYAFNNKERVWKVQEYRLHPEINKFVLSCLTDVLDDPKFMAELASGDNGEMSVTKLRRAQEKFLSARMIASICSRVFHSDKIRTENPDIFDRNNELFYASNGVVNLADGSIRGAEASDYLLCRSTVTYSPAAKCSWWEDFLMEVFEENDNPEKMCSFMQEVFGYSISGNISEQKIFCHYGDGSNGKSKVLLALSLIAGDYATFIDPDEMGRKKHGLSNKTFERLGSKIEGRHIGIIDDMEMQAVWNESFVKNLTSPVIRSRAEHEKSRTVQNRAKIHCGLNQAPAPETENYGILRRLCLVPYVRTFEPKSGTSIFIEKKINEELSGILNWAIKGYQTFKSNEGIGYPADTEIALEEYKQEFFNIDSAVNELFEKPVSEAEGSWEFLSDLVQDVVTFTGTKVEISLVSLGVVLKRKLGLEAKKIWKNDRKNMCKAYFIKLKFKRNEKSNFL